VSALRQREAPANRPSWSGSAACCPRDCGRGVFRRLAAAFLASTWGTSPDHQRSSCRLVQVTQGRLGSAHRSPRSERRLPQFASRW
jgi:hypothetical protein